MKINENQNAHEEIKQTQTASQAFDQNSFGPDVTTELESKYFQLSVDNSFDVVDTPVKRTLALGKKKRFVKRIVRRPNAKKQEEARLRQ